MSDELLDRGPPAIAVDAKRPADKVPVSIDWHDYLINERKPGIAVALNNVVRPRRSAATGLEYKCTTAGVTSSQPFDRIRWTTAAAQAVNDGSVVWTSQAVSSASMRASVSANTWTFDSGVNKSNESTADSIYTAYVDGGSNGENYNLRHAITLSGSPAELKEALIVLPVRD